MPGADSRAPKTDYFFGALLGGGSVVINNFKVQGSGWQQPRCGAVFFVGGCRAKGICSSQTPGTQKGSPLFACFQTLQNPGFRNPGAYCQGLGFRAGSGLALGLGQELVTWP